MHESDLDLSDRTVNIASALKWFFDNAEKVFQGDTLNMSLSAVLIPVNRFVTFDNLRAKIEEKNSQRPEGQRLSEKQIDIIINTVEELKKSSNA
jgi:hypothetical protein